MPSFSKSYREASLLARNEELSRKPAKEPAGCFSAGFTFCFILTFFAPSYTIKTNEKNSRKGNL